MSFDSRPTLVGSNDTVLGGEGERRSKISSQNMQLTGTKKDNS